MQTLGLHSSVRHIRTHDPAQPWSLLLMEKVVKVTQPQTTGFITFHDARNYGYISRERCVNLGDTHACVAPTVSPLPQDVAMCETVRWSPNKPRIKLAGIIPTKSCFSSVTLAAAEVSRLLAVIGPEPRQHARCSRCKEVGEAEETAAAPLTTRWRQRTESEGFICLLYFVWGRFKAHLR